MIRIPDKLAVQIELEVDASFEHSKQHLPLKKELWDSLMALKEEILIKFSMLSDIPMTQELLEEVAFLCVRLGVIRRIELHKTGQIGVFAPLHIA